MACFSSIITPKYFTHTYPWSTCAQFVQDYSKHFRQFHILVNKKFSDSLYQCFCLWILLGKVNIIIGDNSFQQNVEFWTKPQNFYFWGILQNSLLAGDFSKYQQENMPVGAKFLDFLPPNLSEMKKWHFVCQFCIFIENTFTYPQVETGIENGKILLKLWLNLAYFGPRTAKNGTRVSKSVQNYKNLQFMVNWNHPFGGCFVNR